MKSFSFLGVVFLAACSGSPQSSGTSAKPETRSIDVRAKADNSITCWGIAGLEFGDDLATIEEKVGKENVSTDSLFLEGSFERLVTRIWKGLAKEIIVVWVETQPPFKTIKTFEISQPHSPYQFDNGVKIGTSLNEIVKLNGGEPVRLYGFGWDYGGTFIDFGKGKLKGDLPCFGGVFQLEAKTASREAKPVMGDRQISSSSPAFRNLKAILKVIRVSDGQPEKN